MSLSLALRLSPLALLLLTACPSPVDEDTPDAGSGLPPDLCNTRDEALAQADCQLTLGQEVERFISEPGDQDWYSVRLPDTAGPRTLVRVQAGYRALSTAVNLSVGLLGEDGRSLGSKVDAHSGGAPRPVELLVPLGEPGARLLLLLGDAPNRTKFDARSPYFLKVEVLENPDDNEPNDTAAQATPVALAAQNGVLEGSATGYLATAGDVDHFGFDVAAGKVLSVRLTAPELNPPPAYRLAYTLLRPDGTAEAEGNMRPLVTPAHLATARKVAAAGRWTVVVRGYQPSGDTQPPPGDVRQQYTLRVRVLDEADVNEGSASNDDFGKAVVRNLGSTPGGGTRFEGRLGYVPDRDWYAVTLGAHSAPTVLRYRLRPLGTGGRFEPLPSLANRQVRVLTRVTTGATAADQELNCVTREDVCPKGYQENLDAKALVDAFCANRPEVSKPPLCLHSSREEVVSGSAFAGLHNFQGALPVPPHGAAVTYSFLVQDDGNDWADDRDYQLTVDWVADADEAARLSGGVEQPVVRALPQDATGAAFPAPPSGTTYEVGGELTYGYGRLRGGARNTGLGVRGPEDYDAVASDVDTYEYTLPAGLTAPVDRTWELQWVVQHLPDGGVPHGLTLDLTFCDGDRLDGGSCTPVTTGSRGAPLTLAYRSEALRAWHSTTNTLSGLQPLYRREATASATTVTVQPYACGCLEPRFLRGGWLRVEVAASERTDYTPTRYTLRTAYTDYPKTYAADGGSAECPRPAVVDGGTALADGGTSPLVWSPGCVFTRQP